MNTFDITGEVPIQTLIKDFFTFLGLREVTIEQLLQRRIDKIRDLSPGEYISYIHSMTMVDFSVWIKGCFYPLFIDVKDKRQFIPENWGLQQDEKNDWVVFDETAVKKILNIGFTSFIIVQDIDPKVLYLFNSQSIGLSYKKWVLREDMGSGHHKYKLLLPVSESEKHTNLGEVILSMINWVNYRAYELSHSGSQHTWYNSRLEKCFVNRQQRTEKHKITDIVQSNSRIITNK